MYKVIGKENDMFKVLDLDEGTEELLSASELVLGLGQAEIEGCQHSEHGIEVWYDGVEKYEIPIEVWAPVKKYNVKENDGRWRYEVSNFGEVRSFCRSNEPRLLTKGNNPGGYLTVCLSIDKAYTRLVHILVGSVFVYNKYNKYSINHRDECKTNNKAYNLEWMSLAENNAYGTHVQRTAVALMKHVRQYSINGELVKVFESLSSIRDELGFNITHISSCCHHDSGRRIVNGFVWRLVCDDELYSLSVDERKKLISDLKIPVSWNILKIYKCGVRQYSLSGELIKEFSSLAEAEAVTGINSDSISRCCHGSRLTAYGYIWRYVDNDELFDGSVSVDTILGIRYIRKYTLNGVFISEYSKLKDVHLEYGVRGTNVTKVCKRLTGYRTFRGYLWRYSDDDEFADRPENAKAIEEWRKAHNV